MPNFYSPEGNYEVWVKKPEGYFTEEEWEKLHPAPVYVPTKEEKLAGLDYQYENDKAELTKYFVEAALTGNTELQEELKNEMQALNDDYDIKRTELEAEE